MIICSCAVISDHDIKRAVSWMRASDPQSVITPGKVYRALGKRPDCGGCIALFVDSLRRDLHSGVPSELRNLRAEIQEEDSHEGRRQGHRIP